MQAVETKTEKVRETEEEKVMETGDQVPDTRLA